ncbi:hypothetical protein CC86DRAFT_5114 [Ophiobolus disseminans]|uniref:Uncharacterized protein n=1 Tax=Ophiobolus disseminans TaxID=1469910 RepID=A0A6A7AKI8_9PLEO|nr:hypothetical protein CC86DRAFT_5114 [Ophiobolus disseminans]
MACLGRETLPNDNAWPHSRRHSTQLRMILRFHGRICFAILSLFPSYTHLAITYSTAHQRLTPKEKTKTSTLSS